MLYEEFERSLANFKSIKENVANLPEGNLIYKKIKGKAYSYIVKKILPANECIHGVFITTESDMNSKPLGP